MGQKTKTLRYCPHCGTRGYATQAKQGSDGVALALLLLTCVGYVFYEMWRNGMPRYQCPTCRQWGMIPATSPAAGASATQSGGVRQPVTPGAVSLTYRETPAAVASPSGAAVQWKVTGTDRMSGTVRSVYVEAKSDEAAKAAGERRGLAVESVEMLTT